MIDTDAEVEFLRALGEAVRQRRSQAGLSREDLASQVGVSASTLGRLERAEGTAVAIGDVFRIAGSFGVSVPELLVSAARTQASSEREMYEAFGLVLRGVGAQSFAARFVVADGVGYSTGQEVVAALDEVVVLEVNDSAVTALVLPATEHAASVDWQPWRMTSGPHPRAERSGIAQVTSGSTAMGESWRVETSAWEIVDRPNRLVSRSWSVRLVIEEARPGKQFIFPVGTGLPAVLETAERIALAAHRADVETCGARPVREVPDIARRLTEATGRDR